MSIELEPSAQMEDLYKIIAMQNRQIAALQSGTDPAAEKAAESDDSSAHKRRRLSGTALLSAAAEASSSTDPSSNNSESGDEIELAARELYKEPGRAATPKKFSSGLEVRKRERKKERKRERERERERERKVRAHYGTAYS